MKALLALSGGMDSSTLLAVALAEGLQPTCVCFQYGSKHNRDEMAAVVQIGNYYGVVCRFVYLEGVFNQIGATSALLQSGGAVPEGHYEAETMRQTVVPGRNTVFAALLLAIAERDGMDQILLGIHAGDHFIYPDCRPEWLSGIRETVWAATDHKVEVRAPFLRLTKANILTRGLALRVPYEHTRTCYKNQTIACGKCGSCQERLEAFKLNGLDDPLQYASRELLPKETISGLPRTNS